MYWFVDNLLIHSISIIAKILRKGSKLIHISHNFPVSGLECIFKKDSFRSASLCVGLAHKVNNLVYVYNYAFCPKTRIHTSTGRCLNHLVRIHFRWGSGRPQGIKGIPEQNWTAYGVGIR